MSDINATWFEMPEEKDYIIAYVDLLGTKEALKNNDAEIFYNIVFRLNDSLVLRENGR